MLSHSTKDGDFVLFLTGEVNINNLAEIRRQVEACNLDQYDRVIVNLANVSFFDSSGLGYLVVLITQVKRRGGMIVLCEPNELVKTLLSNVQIDKQVSVLATEEEAAGQFRSPA